MWHCPVSRVHMVLSLGENQTEPQVGGHTTRSHTAASTIPPGLPPSPTLYSSALGVPHNVYALSALTSQTLYRRRIYAPCIPSPSCSLVGLS